jgi:long-subunit fatty acid transport protein
MRHLERLVLGALAVTILAPRASAQDSVFGIRGLGLLGRPISARSAGMGGGYALFDGGSAVNPTSLVAWRGAVGWAVGAASIHSFDAGSGRTSLGSTRFPVLGFATPVGSRLVIGVSASDYLNRNWSVQQTDTVTPRGTAIAVTDQTRSIGGVTDIRLAAAYRLSGAVSVGLGLHALAGSTQTSVIRGFTGDTAYRSFGQLAVTDYTGYGASLGMFVALQPRLILGASARFNTRLKAATTDTSATVRLPGEYNAGVYYTPVEGVMIASTLGYSTWSAAAGDLAKAGQQPSRDVWNVGLGAEASWLKLGAQTVPVRAGFRWRQLPFPIPKVPTGASALNETALSAGFSLTAAGARATMDFGIEFGSRSAGALTERFTTVLLGVSILP